MKIMFAGKNKSLEELLGEKQLLVAEVNFLLGKAIPKLEHEYLYCISQLEREASIVQLQIALLSEEIRLREEAEANTEQLSEEKLETSLNTIRKEWESKINKHSYKTTNDTIIFPNFVHEREYRLFLLNSALECLHSEESTRLKTQYAEFVRRITTAYREGNLGELRALRMIIESKQHLPTRSHNKFSLKTILKAFWVKGVAFFSSAKTKSSSNTVE